MRKFYKIEMKPFSNSAGGLFAADERHAFYLHGTVEVLKKQLRMVQNLYVILRPATNVLSNNLSSGEAQVIARHLKNTVCSGDIYRLVKDPVLRSL